MNQSLLKENRVKTLVKNHWDVSSLTYDEHKLGTAEECNQWKKDLSMIIGDPPLQVLDVGTGTGFIGIMLSELGYQVTGLDFSEKMMEKAKNKVKDRNLLYNFVVGDAENPDFADNTFDCVICRHLLWTLPNPEKAIREWTRILKPGGTLCIIDGQWGKRSIKQMLCLPSYWLYQMFVLKSDISKNKYSKDLKKSLPYSDGVSVKKLKSLFTINNFKEIQEKSFIHIRDIQTKYLPWHRKYAYYNEIYGVWGRKAT